MEAGTNKHVQKTTAQFNVGIWHPEFDGKDNLNDSNFIQIFLSMDILWKRMPQQMFRKLGIRIFDEYGPKIKVEPHEERFDGRWQDESALKGIVKVEHEPHFGAVKVEGTIKIKHESADDLDQDNSKEAKHLSDRNNSTDQDARVTKELGGGRDIEQMAALPAVACASLTRTPLAAHLQRVRSAVQLVWERRGRRKGKE
uniref:Uncharacterized protein n=1 Tax=Globodera rostochiensis TaxID=31243 RepID=A0A914HRQ3_GLORO